MNKKTVPRNRRGDRGYAASDPTLTVDRFIGEVSIDTNRCILVYLREHGGRQFVRWRVFHKHIKGPWYPDRRRAFVIPAAIADALARVISAAPDGQAVSTQPAWLAAIDAYREHRLACLRDLNAPASVLEPELRRRHKGLA